jgi:hypothetical protein
VVVLLRVLVLVLTPLLVLVAVCVLTPLLELEALGVGVRLDEALGVGVRLAVGVLEVVGVTVPVALEVARLRVWEADAVMVAVVVCDAEGQPVGEGIGVAEQAAGGATTTPRHCCLPPKEAMVPDHVDVLGV